MKTDKKTWILKKVSEGEMLPKFYGIAWVDYCSRGAYCLPVPINVVFAIARSAWFFMKHGGVEIRMNVRAAYDQGFREGRAKAHGKDWSNQ